MRAPLPRLYAAQLHTLRRCARRFHKNLTDDGPRQRFNGFRIRDQRYALSDAVQEAIATAHRRALDGEQLVEALALPPPAGLEPEQARLFERALDAYAEAAEGRAGRWRERLDATVTTVSGTGRFELTAFPDALFDLPDGGVEVHAVAFGRRPLDPPEARPATQALALALRADPYVRILQLWVSDTVEVEDFAIASEALAVFGPPLAREVIAALDAVDPPATPGSWCAECPFLYGCPGVPQQPYAAVLS